jgi:hypothetical protein
LENLIEVAVRMEKKLGFGKLGILKAVKKLDCCISIGISKKKSSYYQLIFRNKKNTQFSLVRLLVSGIHHREINRRKPK